MCGCTLYRYAHVYLMYVYKGVYRRHTNVYRHTERERGGEMEEPM